MHSFALAHCRAVRFALVVTLIACAGIALACSRPADEPLADTSISNEALGLRFASRPAGFEVAENGEQIVLEGNGTMTVSASAPSDFGLDPIASANAELEHYESLTGGAFLGVRELGTHFGKGAYARGRFEDAGDTVEETVVFVVHPNVNRMISLRYAYPAGEDSGERVQTLLGLVGEMEPVGSTAPEPEPQPEQEPEPERGL